MKNKTVIQNTLTYDLKGYNEEVIAKTKQFIQQLIFKTNEEATRDAPSFISIGNEFEDKGLTGRVGVLGQQTVPKNQSDPANMAAYIEFGTGLSAAQIAANEAKRRKTGQRASKMDLVIDMAMNSAFKDINYLS